MWRPEPTLINGSFFNSLNLKNMKKLLIVLLLVGGFTSVFAQKVYTVSSESYADVKVFVVSSESYADLLVYKVSSESYAGDNNGKWFFVSSESYAKKKIYFVSSESYADLKIFFVNSESYAGWKNDSKKHLMY